MEIASRDRMIEVIVSETLSAAAGDDEALDPDDPVTGQAQLPR